MKRIEVLNLKKLAGWALLLAWAASHGVASAQERPEDRFDGGGSTGGGNAVVCFDDAKIVERIKSPTDPDRGQILDAEIPHITRVTALDLEEALSGQGLSGTQAKIPLFNPADPSSPIEVLYKDWVLEKVWHKFYETLPGLTDFLFEGSEHFTAQNTRYQKHGVQRIDDTRSVGRQGESCVLATVVAQKRLGDATYYDIDERVFKHGNHELLSRVVLLLHEYVYSKLRERGHTDSEPARRFVGLLITEGSGMKASEFLKHAANFGFKEFDQKVTFGYETALSAAKTLYGTAQDYFDVSDPLYAERMKRLKYDDAAYVEPVEKFLGRVVKSPSIRFERTDSEEPKRASNCKTLERCLVVLQELVKTGNLSAFITGWNNDDYQTLEVSVYGIGLKMPDADRDYLKTKLLPSLEKALEARAKDLRGVLEGALTEVKLWDAFRKVPVNCSYRFEGASCMGDVESMVRKLIDDIVKQSGVYSVDPRFTNSLLRDLQLAKKGGYNSFGHEELSKRWIEYKYFWLDYELK